MRVRSLVIALLLFSLFVPAAGAIYIPGQTIPDDGQPHILLADAGSGSAQSSGTYPTADTSGPIKRYLSDDPNDYVLEPGDDPDMMYAFGEGPADASVAISAPTTISTNMPSYVSKPPSVPPIRSMANAANTGAETIMPPDFFATASSSKFNQSSSELQHLNAASQGYDVSLIGSIATPPMPATANIGIPAFSFPALFG